jgi:hypothetical protein
LVKLALTRKGRENEKEFKLKLETTQIPSPPLDGTAKLAAPGSLF